MKHCCGVGMPCVGFCTVVRSGEIAAPRICSPKLCGITVVYSSMVIITYSLELLTLLDNTVVLEYPESLHVSSTQRQFALDQRLPFTHLRHKLTTGLGSVFDTRGEG